MIELAWPIVMLVLIAIANFRLGQYLAPPAQEEIKAIHEILEKYRNEVSELRQKVNSLLVEKGFK